LQETQEFDDNDRIGAIVCDEMFLESGIWWNPNGDIIGLEDADSVDIDIQTLDEYVRLYEKKELTSLTDTETELPDNVVNALDGTSGRRVAKRALQLAFSSFLGHYTSFFAYFLTNDSGFNTLYNILIDGTGLLDAIGMRLITWCGDLASINESCWKSIMNKIGSKNPFNGDPLWPLFALPIYSKQLEML
jgi:hypothetical protein